MKPYEEGSLNVLPKDKRCFNGFHEPKGALLGKACEKGLTCALFLVKKIRFYVFQKNKTNYGFCVVVGGAQSLHGLL